MIEKKFQEYLMNGIRILDKCAEGYNRLIENFGERNIYSAITALVMGIFYGNKAACISSMILFYPQINEKYHLNAFVYEKTVHLLDKIGLGGD